MKQDVLVIGELNIDLVLSGLTAPPQFGSEVLADDMHLVLGSASAIFACGVSRLGHPVSFYSKVGEDDFGRFCLQALEAAGVEIHGVQRSARSRTGATIVLSTREDRALVTCLGAIAELGYEDLPADPFTGFRHLHLTSYFLQTRLRPSFLTLVQRAKQAGLTVSFDPNTDPSQGWGREIWEIFSSVDVVFLNEPEALAVTGQASLDAALENLGGAMRCVVVKQGPRGATALRDGQRMHAAAFPIDAVDTTGAGDSFAAGFVHGLLSHYSLKDCLLVGNAVGALATLAVGGTAGQPDGAELAIFLDGRGAVLGTASRVPDTLMAEERR